MSIMGIAMMIIENDMTTQLRDQCPPPLPFHVFPHHLGSILFAKSKHEFDRSKESDGMSHDRS